MILMNDFKKETDDLRLETLNAMQKVSESGYYLLGPELDLFERNWAEKCNVKDAIGVANGMDAIEIALRSLNIGPGDEVVTTSMTAFATVLAIYRSGATPVLADIAPETGLMCIDSARRCLSKKTKAILLVHLYGYITKMEDWCNLSKSEGIHLIEDCAQSHLSTYCGKSAGSFGAAGAFSFYPTKNLGALGDAGALVTNDEKIAKSSRRLRNYGQSERYHHPILGLNSRLDEIQAAILNVRLNYLESYTSRRREIAKLYNSHFKNELLSVLEEPVDPKSHSYHLYVINTNYRDLLINFLDKNGIQTFMHYPLPISAQRPCENIAIDPAGLPNTSHHAKTCLSIPCHPTMSDMEVFKVIEFINKFRV